MGRRSDAKEAASVPPRSGYTFVPSPPDLAARVNTFYQLQTGAGRIEEMLPAYSAQLLVFASGSARIRYAGGGKGRSGRVTINAPMLQAARIVIDGPALVFGASLTPIGWAALTGMPVDEVHDMVLPPQELLAAATLARIERAAQGPEDGGHAIIGALADALRAADRGPPPAHLPTIETIGAWLANGFDPALEQLHQSASVSPRQLQRVSRRYFGVPPAQVLKRVRAIRAAMMLANPELPEAMRDEVLGAYFDQAHLIRDLRRYTGRTPGHLRIEGLAPGSFDPVAHGALARLLRADRASALQR